VITPAPAQTGLDFRLVIERTFKSTSEVAANVEGAAKPRYGKVRIRSRGRLPHWEKEAGLYFVTFRLSDTLPESVLEKIAERHRVLESAQRSGLNLTPEQKRVVEEYSTRRIEEYSDRGSGACLLRDPRITPLVANALRFWNGKRYRLVSWCIMPNHVHVVVRMSPGQELADVLRGWKSYTARTANRILGHTGSFWQREYYDRLIRDENELERVLRYVASNPERAGLKGWMRVWSAGVDARTTAGLETGATPP
jgi:REP element-mobilizing transposase RayT